MGLLGAWMQDGATHFALRAPLARAVWLCLFDADDAETRLPMVREGDDWRITLPGDHAGARYGYRADGDWAPDQGRWFDAAKLLVDPYAVELDRRFEQAPALAQHGVDTAAIVPRAIVPGALPLVEPAPPMFTRGGLIYEVNVRGFTLLHPDVPEPIRGTVAALAHPSVIAHLRRLHVSAVQLLPIVAWLDERHLPPLGLRNAWGYNPVAMMALDPGLCPGGVAELREAVAALHGAGIGVLLDLVFNHTGESDIYGGVLSLRGLDNAAYAHAADGSLINDTGCGNTLDFAQGAVRALTVAALRHFVAHCGVDGFRFDLAPVLARGGQYGPGFDPAAPIFAEIAADPFLADRVMIAEPWDIGPGGYQLGHFPPHWLEWNDVFRDDVRRFWQGAAGFGALATRLAGSADIFGEQACRSVNFLAAHDGFTLADTVAYEQRHNHANGENNRDGHHANHSWNCGVEGPSDDPQVMAARARDVRALLGCLFASTGTIMLTAGDEFGRTQRGNNNAYCQDSPIGWVDWAGRDLVLEGHVAGLSAWRAGIMAAHPGAFAQFPRAGVWQQMSGAPLGPGDWGNPDLPGLRYLSQDAERPLGFVVDRLARRAGPG
ncbi:glycogen debranching protein GlgX [Novosphingobium sp. FSY-8]|uniref:Glycogen debranching protein GlgX n=1 Tax=Novosphingobium ovatum TaxID=1908523 RepID=A0ABW9X9J9_9SPHN|nr:glycogen debranching protein GlgX [Novosphingobium ovatum]NBC35195.1 glycogen debranching protein GlgX [Novosphingobium ovatum]